MTFEEVKAIFTSGGSVNARLLMLHGVEGDMTAIDAINVSGAYLESTSAETELVSFRFLLDLSSTSTLYWGSIGVISTSSDKALGRGEPE